MNERGDSGRCRKQAQKLRHRAACEGRVIHIHFQKGNKRGSRPHKHHQQKAGAGMRCFNLGFKATFT